MSSPYVVAMLCVVMVVAVAWSVFMDNDRRG